MPLRKTKKGAEGKCDCVDKTQNEAEKQHSLDALLHRLSSFIKKKVVHEDGVVALAPQKCEAKE